METFRQILDDLTTTSCFGLSLIESEGMVLRVLELSGDENSRVMETLIRACRKSMYLTPLNLHKGPHSMNIYEKSCLRTFSLCEYFMKYVKNYLK